MHSSRTQMSSHAVLAVIKPFSGLSGVSLGKQVHGLVVNYGFDVDVYVQSALMDFYAKNAECSFDEMKERTVASWNSMISCYANNGYHDKGLEIFERMQAESIHPIRITSVILLSLSAKLRDLELGLKAKKLIHDGNICINTIVLTAMMKMFVKFGAVDKAHQEFYQMSSRDILAWSNMMAGYVQNKRPTGALQLFERMERE
ncbi:hypothetical protein REPUB_Repub08aG0073900 [Reevesia pubescens]